MHDAILVGIGTALNDDPQLNGSDIVNQSYSYLEPPALARHLPPPSEHEERRHLPRPVVVDSRLRLSPTCKLLINYQNGRGRRPWVICASAHDAEFHGRLAVLEKAGAKVIQIPIEGR